MDFSEYAKSNWLTGLEVRGSNLVCTNCNHTVTNVRGVERAFSPWSDIETVRFEIWLPRSLRPNPRWDPALMAAKIGPAEAEALFRPPPPDPMVAYLESEKKDAELDEQLRSLAAERVKPA